MNQISKFIDLGFSKLMFLKTMNIHCDFDTYQILIIYSMLLRISQLSLDNVWNEVFDIFEICNIFILADVQRDNNTLQWNIKT